MKPLRVRRILPIAVPLALLFSIPFWVGSYDLRVLIIAGIAMINVLGYNIAWGFSGQFVIIQAAFWAIGAYTSALLALNFGLSFWLTFPITIVFVSILGLIVGFIMCRWRGHYVALVSIGIGVIIYEALLNLVNITGGAFGLRGIPQPSPINLFNVYTLDFSAPSGWYFITLIVLILSVIVCLRIRDSQLGRAFFAIRDDEIAAGVMGVNVFKTKVLGFALSTPFAAAAGSIYAHYLTIIVAEMATVVKSLMLLVMMVVGGIGNVWGVMLGAFIFVTLPEYLRIVEAYRLIIVGGLLILFLLFAPDGLIGLPKRLAPVIKKAYGRVRYARTP